MAQRLIKLAMMNPEIVAREIGDFILREIVPFGGTGGVIGLSGGVDSTVTADLAQLAFARYNDLSYKERERRYHARFPKIDLELVGYILPSNNNTPEDEQDGVKVARKIGIRYEVINIQPSVDGYRLTCPEAFENDYDKGNLISTVRANVLQRKAAKETKSIIGTGNWDEDFGIGFYTMFGDGAVYMCPIGNLPKRLVKEMARHRGYVEIANKEPSPGLRKGLTSFLELGYHYEFAEIILRGEIQGLDRETMCGECQAQEWFEKDKELYIQLCSKPKFRDISEAVDNVLWRHEEVALRKQEIVNPPVADITLTYGFV